MSPIPMRGLADNTKFTGGDDAEQSDPRNTCEPHTVAALAGKLLRAIVRPILLHVFHALDLAQVL